MPHADETFYKMKCGWAEDPKVEALARFGAVDMCLGRDLFSQMIDYARRNLTDGWVPANVPAKLMHPLPADDVMRVAMQLASDGQYGPLCEWHQTSNAFRICAYPKWNDTRADVSQRIEHGRSAAHQRWDAARNANGTAGGTAPGTAGGTAARTAPGTAGGIDRARARVHTEQEQEQEQEQELVSGSVVKQASRRYARARGRPRVTAEHLRRVLDLHAAKGITGVMAELGYSERNARRLLARARALGQADAPSEPDPDW